MHKALMSIWKESALEEKLLHLYVILMPFLDYFIFTFCNKKILYADFVFLLLFVVWVSKYALGKIKIDFVHLKFSLVLLPVLFSFSFLNSSSLLSTVAEMLSLVYLVLLFIVVINIINNYQKLRLVLFLYVITSTVLSLVGLGLLIKAMILRDLRTTAFLGYGTMESMAHHFPRIDLAFESANMALAYLHVALVFGIILFLTEKKKAFRTFIALSLVIMLSAAFFTGSRRFTGLILSLFLIVCWYGRGKISSMLKYSFFLGFLAFLAVSIVTTIWVVFPLKVARDEVAKSISIKADYSYSIHYLLPAVSLHMFKEHPFVGIGFGTFNKNFKEYVDWDWLKSSFGFEAYPRYVELVRDKKLNFDPHSLFFGTLAETGLVGLCALVYFLIVYGTSLAVRFKASRPDSFDKVLSGCLLAGFIGFILNALTLDILSMRHFWFMLAVGYACLNEGAA